MFNDLLAVPEYERAVLSVALTSQAARESTSHLSTGDFANPSNGAIWEAVQSLHAQGEAVDILTVIERLTRWERLTECGGTEYIEELASNGHVDANSARTYAKRVSQASLARQTIRVASDLGMLANRAMEMDEDELRAEFNAITQQGLPAPNKSLISRADQDISQLVNWMIEGRDLGVPLRIKSPNISAAGGMARMMYPGMLSTIIGASGDGKTAWLSQVAENAAMDGANVAIVDGEITPDLAAARRLQRYSGIRADTQMEMTYDTSLSHDTAGWHAIRNAEEAIKDWTARLYYFYAPEIPLYSVVDELRELHRQTPLDLVILDYIQLFSRLGDGRLNEAQVITWNMQTFKNFCGSIGCHGYVGSQFSNEAVKSAQPRTQYGAKGSGSIGEKSNLVITINRPINTSGSKLHRRVVDGNGGTVDVWVDKDERDILATFRVDKNTFGEAGKQAAMILNTCLLRWDDGNFDERGY